MDINNMGNIEVIQNNSLTNDSKQLTVIPNSQFVKQTFTKKKRMVLQGKNNIFYSIIYQYLGS